MRNSKCSAIVIAALSAFVAPGWGSIPASAQSSSPIDRGLVHAFDAVGKALLGDAVFAARTGEFESRPALILDVSQLALETEVLVNAFPTQACRTGCRLLARPSSIGFEPDIQVLQDPGAFIMSDPPPFEIEDLGVDSPLCPLTRASRRSTVNAGLVQALDAVGKRLLGQAAFSARIDPQRPEALILDIGTNSALDVVVNVLSSPSSCFANVRLIVDGGTREGIRHQFSLTQGGIKSDWSFGDADLSDVPPDPCGGLPRRELRPALE